MQIIYAQYEPKEKPLGRILENCLYDVLREKHGIEPLETKTGSGYLHLVLNSPTRIEKPEDLIDEISKEVYEHHRNIFLSEESARLEYRQFLLSRLAEYGAADVSEVKKILADAAKVGHEDFQKKAHSLELKLVEDMKDAAEIAPRAVTLPELSQKKPALKGYELVEYGWTLEIKNVAEAVMVSWLYGDFHDMTRFEFYRSGVTAYASGNLHKLPGQTLFVNMSLVVNQLPEFKLAAKSPANAFENKRREFLAKTRPEDFGLVDAFYQMIDWGVRLDDKEFVNVLKKTSFEEAEKLFAEKEGAWKAALPVRELE